MSVGTLKARELAKRRKSGYLLDIEWVANEDQQVWYEWGVSKGIIISPIPVTDKPGKWFVGVSEPGKHKKVYKSKFQYDWKQIWDEVMNAYKYYYDKEKN